MNFKNIKTIWKKEVRDTVRDRRTMLSMILIPMLLIPVILVGMFKFMESQQKAQEQKTVKVALVGEGYAPEIADAFKKDKRMEIVTLDEDIDKAVADGRLDAAIVIPESFAEDIRSERPAGIQFVEKSTNLNAMNVYSVISSAVAEYNNNLLQQRFSSAGVNPKILTGAKVETKDVATSQETSGFILALIIPMFIVIYSIVGGQYTAIDVSAGEKERKTLEALLLTPARRVEIVMGKFLAVSTVALVSIVIAIGSLYVSFSSVGNIGSSMQSTNMGATSAAVSGASIPNLDFSVDPQAALLLFAVSVFLVLMFSAIILSISIFAKSFKEAESYIGPAYMIVILPIVFINSAPGFEPALLHFAIPAVNAVLLFKEVLMGTYDVGHIALTFVSLILSSAVAIVVATKIYSRESVLFND